MLALKTAAFRPLKVTAGSRARGAVPVLELSAVHFVRPSRTHLRVAPFAGPVLHEKSVETRDVTLLRPHGPGAQDTARPALRIGDWRALGDLELGRTQNRRHTRDADPVFQEVAHIAADPAIFCPDEGAGLRLRRTLQALSVVPRSAVKCEKKPGSQAGKVHSTQALPFNQVFGPQSQSVHGSLNTMQAIVKRNNRRIL